MRSFLTDVAFVGFMSGSNVKKFICRVCRVYVGFVV